jgi:hypothetical protein
VLEACPPLIGQRLLSAEINVTGVANAKYQLCQTCISMVQQKGEEVTQETERSAQREAFQLQRRYEVIKGLESVCPHLALASPFHTKHYTGIPYHLMSGDGWIDGSMIRLRLRLPRTGWRAPHGAPCRIIGPRPGQGIQTGEAS